MSIFDFLFLSERNLPPEERLLHSLKVVLAGLDGVLGVDRMPCLSYGDVIRWFVANRPEYAGKLKGALLRRHDPCGHQMIWLFLNERNEPLLGATNRPLGRKAVVAELDEELLECFADRDLLIFA